MVDVHIRCSPRFLEFKITLWLETSGQNRVSRREPLEAQEEAEVREIPSPDMQRVRTGEGLLPSGGMRLRCARDTLQGDPWDTLPWVRVPGALATPRCHAVTPAWAGGTVPQPGLRCVPTSLVSVDGGQGTEGSPDEVAKISACPSGLLVAGSVWQSTGGQRMGSWLARPSQNGVEAATSPLAPTVTFLSA